MLNLEATKNALKEKSDPNVPKLEVVLIFCNYLLKSHVVEKTKKKRKR